MIAGVGGVTGEVAGGRGGGVEKEGWRSRKRVRREGDKDMGGGCKDVIICRIK